MKCLSVVLLLAGLSLRAQSGIGIIQGIVVDASTGKPTTGAFVTAMRTGLPPASQTAKVAADGSFSVQNLTSGTYSLCVQAPGDGLLDPCDWSATPVSVSLAAGQTSIGNTVKVTSGSILKIHVLDPGGLLGQKTALGNDPHLMIGVSHRGTFHPAHVTAKNPATTEFQLTVPRDNLVTLLVQSRNLALADNAGAALLGNKISQPFQHKTGDPSPQSFVFSVQGKLP